MLKAYVSMGLTGACAKHLLKVIAGKENVVDAYQKLLQQAVPVLRKRYAVVLDEKEREYKDRQFTRVRSNRVWVCWLQGMDQAPDLVKVCYESLKAHLTDKEIILISEENIHEYVTLPDVIEKKYRKGVIPAAHYTDMLRLQLLIEHGGTWVDATVWCSGDDYPREIMDTDLFVFQHLGKGEYVFRGLSNWFITSCTNHQVLMVVRDMLCAYWQENDCVLDYFMFHLFFCMVMERHPEVAAKMPRYGNAYPHYLSRRVEDEYDEQWMTELKKRSCFHKLSYRIGEKAKRKGTFYDVVIQQSMKNKEE